MQGGAIILHLSSPDLTYCIFVVQYQYQEPDIGTILRAYSDFTSRMCTCVCVHVCFVVLCNFITWVAFYNHQNQDTCL